jgi:hypothetical protein
MVGKAYGSLEPRAVLRWIHPSFRAHANQALFMQFMILFPERNSPERQVSI